MSAKTDIIQVDTILYGIMLFVVTAENTCLIECQQTLMMTQNRRMSLFNKWTSYPLRSLGSKLEDQPPKHKKKLNKHRVPWRSQEMQLIINSLDRKLDRRHDDREKKM